MNSSFSTQLPTLQLAWDSTSLGEFKTCAYKYYLSIVRGFTRSETNVHLTFGILLHTGREHYYHARATGTPHDDAMRKALRCVMELSWDQRTNRPWISTDPNKNRLTLVRTLIWYLDHWSNDPMRTLILANGKPAVELSFRFEIDYVAPTNEPYMLCGHLDRVGIFQEKLFLSDLKSTKHTLTPEYYEVYSPDNQMSLYSFAAKVAYSIPIAGIVIDACQVAVTFSRFMRGPVMRTESQLTEWYRGLGHELKRAEICAQENFWPQNDKACFRCEYREFCRKPPEDREQWLEHGLRKRTWDPLQARGDI